MFQHHQIICVVLQTSPHILRYLWRISFAFLPQDSPYRYKATFAEYVQDSATQMFSLSCSDNKQNYTNITHAQYVLAFRSLGYFA